MLFFTFDPTSLLGDLNGNAEGKDFVTSSWRNVMLS
jgi:hypothetical protein